MRQSGSSPRGSGPRIWARGVFERARGWYFGLAPGIVRMSGLILVGLAAAVAAVLDWPILIAVVFALVMVLVVHFTLRSPSGMATALVVACWLAAVVPLANLYPEGEHPREHVAALLAVLALPVAFAAHRIRAFTPWRTAALTLALAAVTAAAFGQALPELHALPAWVAALVMLGYRWAQGRRAVPAEAYDTGWVRESEGVAYAEAPYESPEEEREPGGNVPGDPPRREPEVPEISVREALSGLEAMIGLDGVKRQVRSIAASIEAARLRAQAGVPTPKPMRHFVFVGPSGTGKTTVARIVADVFYAFGLLPTANVVEAQRADLVGEHLGSTAIKTNELVDRAQGGVLFIDEAYSLVNAADGQPDRFGNEAVQTLLKRAEDDRDNVVIILAGYEKEMETFLGSNPGLASRFGTRIGFPTYSAEELLRIADFHAAGRGDRLDEAARDRMWARLTDVARRGIVDELGNGRFVRSLAEAAARARDVRVVGAAREPTPEELVTVGPDDVDQAFAEVTERFRGYAETPTLEEALGELDEMIGLGPVKHQVHEIAAQLQVAKLRQQQGLRSQPPMRHFVFAGPPGTGKTTVARVLGRIFAALGLLARPNVVEAQRSDLVGEHLGATALKTNKLIDSALGGVLFVDEAYALTNPGYAGGDAFGAEAVQTLLKRAEDDRERLVVVLAGYDADMDRFLSSNPGLASRFATRVMFPSYGPDELLEIAQLLAVRGGDTWEDAALDELAGGFQRACGRGWIDELGNGRFARTLYEKACAVRDVRVSRMGGDATAADLTTLTATDTRTAFAELTARLR